MLFFVVVVVGFVFNRKHIGPFTIFHGSAEDKHMEKINYSVDLLSLQRLCFYSPCHSQVENFLFHDNKQKAQDLKAAKQEVCSSKISPLQWDRGGEKSMRGLL